jgi:hypothetical protein
MRPAVKVLVYLVALLVLAALLAPPLYWLGRWALHAGLVPQLRGVKFSSYFNRAVLLLILATGYWFVRWLGIPRWRDLGLERNPHRVRDVLLGAVGAALGLWLVGAALVVTDEAMLRTLRWAKLLPIVLTAVAVPIIEEVIFRGVVFGSLRRVMEWRRAAVSVSLVFAVLHYVGPTKGAPKISPIRWYSGFEHLPRLIWQFRTPEDVLPGVLTLFLVGLILCYTVVQTRSLALAMGLHGGWVFALRSFERFSRRTEEPSIWVGQDIRTGILPVALLLLTFGILAWWFRRKHPASSTGVDTKPGSIQPLS